MTENLVFLNSHRAKSGTVGERSLPADYVLLAKFFSCGPIDRTRTLDINVPYEVLQDIPTDGTGASFAELCQQVADDIVKEAIEEDRGIQVAWSGGIDSTVALVSLVERLRDRGELQRLCVLMSTGSMREYPGFYERFIVDELRTSPLPGPLPDAVNEDVITITGEHGDQLFGSDHLASLVKSGVAHLPYRHVIPFYAAEKLRSRDNAERVMRYLEPQVSSAPVPIETAFDYLWWCNFSLKWQQVSLRIPAFRRGHVSGLRDRLRHFFGDPRFQAWSLSNGHVRRVRDWRAYKMEAKKVVLDATGDFDYFATKEKAPSLKHVLVDRIKQGTDRYRVHMYDDFFVHFEVFQKKGNRTEA